LILMEMLAITVYTLLALYTGIKAVFSGVLVIRYLVLCVCFVDRCLSDCTFMAIVLYVLLLLSDYCQTFFNYHTCILLFYSISNMNTCGMHNINFLAFRKYQTSLR
jgi:hypothetical protein